MKESFDQHAGHRPLPSTGSRQAAHSGGKARSSTVRNTVRAAALGPATFLLDRVADDLAERLTSVLRRFEVAVDLGTPGEAVRNALARLESVGRIVAADVMPDAARGEIFVAADEEALPFGDATLDLVVSALALQFVNDLPGVLVQVRRALKPDGLLLAAL